MNATPNISTPVVRAALKNPTDIKAAEEAKNRIQKSTIREVI